MGRLTGPGWSWLDPASQKTAIRGGRIRGGRDESAFDLDRDRRDADAESRQVAHWNRDTLWRARSARGRTTVRKLPGVGRGAGGRGRRGRSAWPDARRGGCGGRAGVGRGVGWWADSVALSESLGAGRRRRGVEGAVGRGP